MAYTLKVENEQGDILDLSGSPNIRIIKVGGLSPAPAEISTIDAVGYDGGSFSYARTGYRNITLQLVPVNDIEVSRQLLYTYFQPKKKVRLYFENSNRNVYIDGYVETNDVDLFSEMQTADISILCPNPYFIENENTEHTMTESGRKLTITLQGGEAESGCIFDISIKGDSMSNISPVVIENETSGEKIEIDYQFPVVFGLGKVYINTEVGSKQAIYNNMGNKKNIMSSLTIDNYEWVKLHSGENVFSVYCKNYSGDVHTMLDAKITAYKYYTGV